MKNILLTISSLLICIGITANDQTTRRRLIINETNGSQKVYDISRLSRITFDSVETVKPQLEFISAKGFSMEVSVTLPEEASMYSIAVAKPDVEVEDWPDYIIQNRIVSGTESGIVELSGLSENTEYNIAALAYDRYEMPSGVDVITASTTMADESELPKVGHILYSDGSWSKRRQNGKTPIGIIFSTDPSESDRDAGYTHGYALALRNAAEKICWTENPAPLQTDWYASSVAYGFQTDMNGLTHTEVLESKGIENFPAAKAALEYTAPVPPTSSGWYLPSSGQWYEICVNLGGLNPEMPRLGETEGYWNGMQDCSNSLMMINEYLSLTGTGNYDRITVPAGDYQWFWTSSEMSTEQAYVIFFDNDQLVVEIAGYFKNYSFASNRVRAVLAF